MTQVINESGAEIASRDYNAFGEIVASSGAWPIDLGYQTNWQTVNIGNKLWGLSAARLYDFSTGRFTQRDPLPELKRIVNAKGRNSFGIFASTILESMIITEVQSPSYSLNLYNYLSYSPGITVDPTGLLNFTWNGWSRVITLDTQQSRSSWNSVKWGLIYRPVQTTWFVWVRDCIYECTCQCCGPSGFMQRIGKEASRYQIYGGTGATTGASACFLWLATGVPGRLGGPAQVCPGVCNIPCEDLDVNDD